ncbi:MAG: NfeD family protein [Prevotella sp.]|nr:NfeD family protein [Prevotella sp.]
MIEYLLANMWQVWAVLAVLGLILELTSGDFFIMCLAIGAAGAAITAPFANLYWQIGVFAIVSLFSLFQVRPFVLRYLHNNEEKRVSNADALLGRKGRVSETIPAGGFGYVAIDGDQWRAVAVNDEEIAEGTRVKIVSRESTIVTVEQLVD